MGSSEDRLFGTTGLRCKENRQEILNAVLFVEENWNLRIPGVYLNDPKEQNGKELYCLKCLYNDPSNNGEKRITGECKELCTENYKYKITNAAKNTNKQ